jgi:hypothetical protein
MASGGIGPGLTFSQSGKNLGASFNAAHQLAVLFLFSGLSTALVVLRLRSERVSFWLKG